tara:strand:+ start:12 stop:854 length:843 start_codon:yes stop_codon:yes gene_type:complete
MIKLYIKNIINIFFKILLKIKFFRSFVRLLNKSQFDNYETIKFSNFEIKFSNPNNITDWRIKTFNSKEPETLDWISKFSSNSTFWDIGANIGQYSIYAAKKINNINVISFEPSVFNLEILARNIYINNLDNISIMSLPIFDKIENNYFSLSNLDWGGALSNFGTNKNWEGDVINTEFSYKTFSLNPIKFISTYNLVYPDYLKIDVDGVENIILKSFGQNIKHIKSVLIEVNDNFVSQKNDIESFLINNNFKLIKKEQSELIKNFPKTFHNSYNQIWNNNE